MPVRKMGNGISAARNLNPWIETIFERQYLRSMEFTEQQS